jgi:hypothetical protein
VKNNNIITNRIAIYIQPPASRDKFYFDNNKLDVHGDLKQQEKFVVFSTTFYRVAKRKWCINVMKYYVYTYQRPQIKQRSSRCLEKTTNWIH